MQPPSDAQRRLADAAARLLQGEDGASVVSRLRPHYNSPHSLATNACKVKAAVLANNRRHHQFDDAALRQYVHEAGVCDFLGANLKVQLREQARHAKNPQWSNQAEQCLAELKLLPDNMRTFKVSAEETRRIKTAKADAATARRANGVVIPHAADLLAKATASLANASVTDTYATLVCALGLVSGRRKTELLNGRSTFAVAGERSVVFSGQLKKGDQEDAPYCIPLLVKATIFVKALSVLREKQGDVTSMTNEQISSRYSKTLSIAIAKETPGLDHFHQLRSLYGRLVNVCYDVRGSETMPSENHVLMTLLGHDEPHESLPYLTLHLKHDVSLESLRHTFGPWVVD
jgi:hypothetical protein